MAELKKAELLEVKNLSVSFFSPRGEICAVRDVSFSLKQGEVLAIVGESGCGKSALCKSIMKLLPEHAKIKSGSILINGADITNYGDKQAIIDEAIELLGPDIAVIHLKDCAVRDGKLLSMGCGQGEMDYTSILKFIKERKPYIHATLEDTRPENNQRVKHFITRKYAELT